MMRCLLVNLKVHLLQGVRTKVLMSHGRCQLSEQGNRDPVPRLGGNLQANLQGNLLDLHQILVGRDQAKNKRSEKEVQVVKESLHFLMIWKILMKLSPSIKTKKALPLVLVVESPSKHHFQADLNHKADKGNHLSHQFRLTTLKQEEVGNHLSHQILQMTLKVGATLLLNLNHIF